MTATIPFFDGHNDFLLRLMTTPGPREDTWPGAGAGHLDLARMKAAGFAGGLFAIFVPSPSRGDSPDFKTVMAQAPYAMPASAPLSHAEAQPGALSMAGMLHWMERAEPEDFRVCRSVPDIRRAMDDGAIAGVMHMEGAETIGPDLDALYLFHQMGLRSLGPVWSRDTIFGYGVPMAYPGTPDTGPGLTERGKDLVRLCDALGIMIDLSHLNEKGFDDVAAVSTAPPVSPYILQAGSVIPAALITGIRSDLPGQITAQVTENVYDSPTGALLLIPQGTRIIGQYDDGVAFGQRRVLLAWNRLILPGGRSIVLERLPGADASGYAGLEDGVDHHWWDVMKAAGLSTLLGIGTELASDSEDRLIRAIRDGAQDTINQAGQQIVQRQLQVDPTLTIRPGFPVRIIVTRDLVIAPTGE